MNAIKAALFAALEADRLSPAPGSLGTLGVTGVHEGEAPLGAVPPYVVFHQVDGRERPTFRTPLAMRTRRYLIKAVDLNAEPQALSSKRAGDIDERINVVVVTNGLTVAGYATVAVVRNYPIDERAAIKLNPTDEKAPTVLARFVGAHYQVTVQ